MPKREIYDWSWETAAGQESFAECVGFDDRQISESQVAKIEKLIGLRPCKAIDVGCGTGRQTLIFAEKGYDILGIDIAEKFLSQAVAEAKRSGSKAAFRLQRASEIAERDTFDFALAFHHSIGFLSDMERPLHFEKIRECLKESGVFLFEMAGPKLPPPSAVRDWKETENKFILVDKKTENGYRKELCIVIDKESGDIKEYRERQRAFSRRDILSLLESSGFRKIDCYADLNGRAATDSDFGIFVCRK